MKLSIGGVTFGTKAALEAHVRARLLAMSGCRSMRQQFPADFAFFTALLERHPKAATKLADVVDLRTRPNAYGKGMCLYFKTSAGVEDDVAWVQCVNGQAPSTDMKLCKALRHAVMPQTQVVSASAVRSQESCGECGCALVKGETDADHDGVGFDALRRAFETARPDLKAPDAFDQDPRSHQHRFLEIDREYRDAWIDYHREHAKLRAICHACNMSIGKPGRAKVESS